MQTLKEAQQFADVILYFAKQGKTDSSNNLGFEDATLSPF